MSEQDTETVSKKIGRPKKSTIASKTTGSRNKVGRPKGDAAIMNDFKARLLASPKSRKVFDSILNAALDDEHKHQAAAWKLLMDRMLPVGMFEQDVTKGNQRASVNITISGVGGESINIGSPQDEDTEDEIIEGDFREE